MYYPNLVFFVFYIYYLYGQGVLSGLIDMLISMIYVFDSEWVDFTPESGPTKEDIGVELFSFMHYQEKAFYVVQFFIALATLGLNGYWALGNKIMLGQEFPIIISDELLYQLLDTLGLLVTSINLIFVVIKFFTIDVSVPFVMDYDTMEGFHWVLLWDIFKLITWTGGLVLFTAGTDFFQLFERKITKG